MYLITYSFYILLSSSFSPNVRVTFIFGIETKLLFYVIIQIPCMLGGNPYYFGLSHITRVFTNQKMSSGIDPYAAEHTLEAGKFFYSYLFDCILISVCARFPGWFPYLKLGQKISDKIDATEEKLDKHSATTATFFVHPQPNVEEADEGWFDPFGLTVALDSLVEDVKRAVKQKTQDTWSPIDPDKNIALAIERNPLKEGETLNDHIQVIERGKGLWPSPYCGILFVFAGDFVPRF